MTEPVPAPGAPEPAPETPPVVEPTGPDPNEPVDINSLPANVQKVIADLRKEAGASRTNAKKTAAEEAKADLWQQISSALGFEKPPADPAELAAQLATADSDAASARLELDVYRAAIGLEANPVKLLDSMAFRQEVDNLDDDGFDDGLKALVRARLEADPSLRLGSAPAATSHRPVEALQPGAMPNPPEPNLDDQIQAAQKAGNAREVIRLNGLKMQQLAANRK